MAKWIWLSAALPSIASQCLSHPLQLQNLLGYLINLFCNWTVSWIKWCSSLLMNWTQCFVLPPLLGMPLVERLLKLEIQEKEEHTALSVAQAVTYGNCAFAIFLLMTRSSFPVTINVLIRTGQNFPLDGFTLFWKGWLLHSCPFTARKFYWTLWTCNGEHLFTDWRKSQTYANMVQPETMTVDSYSLTLKSVSPHDLFVFKGILSCFTDFMPDCENGLKEKARYVTLA